MDLHINDWPLSYVEQLQLRSAAQIELVVIHCTELPDLAEARVAGERVLYPSGTGNSGHFYIDRDGQVHAWVPVERIAHHVRGHNARSIGIELVNIGRYPDWLSSRSQRMPQPYSDEQIAALRQLLRELQAQLPNLREIAGHEDLDREQVPASDDPTQRVYRKRDPGPHFPWAEVLSDSTLRRVTGADADA
ncbi:MAG: N-acetylmuramoyl-L-alanine amidase [Xanthomonadales bacterium]|nr:N-acetylmuramoyl-L-alanine amidase [Xanthomonadales bacterium]